MAFVSDFVTATDPLIRFSLFAGLGVLLLTLLMLIQILMLRLRLLVQRRRRQRFLAQWRPLLMQSMLQRVDPLPILKRGHTEWFLHEWNHLHDTTRGEVIEHVNRLAQRLGIDHFARRGLQASSLSKRLSAIVTLGNLQEYSAWDELSLLCRQHNVLLSLAAANALVQIDAKQAVKMLLPIVARRHDWPAAGVAAMLKRAGPALVCQPLAMLTQEASLDMASRLIRYLGVLHCHTMGTTVANLLRSTQDEHVISTCLQVLNDPRSLDLARKYSEHQRWHIRVHAATALGRLGQQQDVPLLTRMLGDEQWWVRYRAAQALVNLPFVTQAQLHDIEQQLSDKFARHMLRHVLAEVTGT